MGGSTWLRLKNKNNPKILTCVSKKKTYFGVKNKWIVIPQWGGSQFEFQNYESLFFHSKLG